MDGNSLIEGNWEPRPRSWARLVTPENQTLFGIILSFVEGDLHTGGFFVFVQIGFECECFAAASAHVGLHRGVCLNVSS